MLLFNILHPNFQSHLPLFHLPACSKVLPRSTTTKYSLGYLNINASLSTHLSSQNLISFSSSMAQSTLFSNSPPPSEFQTFFRSLHQRESLLFMVVLSNPFHPPYLDSKISFHKPFLSILRHQIHLLINTILNYLKSLTLSPLSFPEAHNLSQDTQAIFHPSEPQPHKNLFILFYSSFVTDTYI